MNFASFFSAKVKSHQFTAQTGFVCTLERCIKVEFLLKVTVDIIGHSKIDKLQRDCLFNRKEILWLVYDKLF